MSGTAEMRLGAISHRDGATWPREAIVLTVLLLGGPVEMRPIGSGGRRRIANDGETGAAWCIW